MAGDKEFELGSTRARKKASALDEDKPRKKKKKPSAESKKKTSTDKPKKKKKILPEDKPKKKKKKPSTELIPADKPKKKKTKKPKRPEIGEVEVLDRAFEAELSKPHVRENDQMQEYVRMFRKLSRLAKMQEKKCLDGTGGSREIYALLKIYDQMREIIADLRALADITDAGEAINELVVTPFANATASLLAEHFQKIKGLIQTKCGDDVAPLLLADLRRITTQSAVELQNSLGDARGNVIKALAQR